MSLRILSVFYDHIKAVVLTSSMLELGITFFWISDDDHAQSHYFYPKVIVSLSVVSQILTEVDLSG